MKSRVLRRSVLVLCGPKAELKRLFFDPEGPLRDFGVSQAAHRRTWRKLEDAWHCTVDSPSCAALGFTMAYNGDAFIVLPKADAECTGSRRRRGLSSRVSYVDMGTGDMEVAVYLDGKKKLSVPFNVRREMRGKEDGR